MSEIDSKRLKFREAMSRLGAAVNIITTVGNDGDIGMTVSAVCSVTDEPATVIVCINRSSRQYEAFKQAGIICVNVLAPEQEDLSPVFAGKGDLPMSERFAKSKWFRLITNAPALAGAAASLDCRVSQSVDVGTHTVFMCTVEDIHLGESAECLVYHGRSYHALRLKQ